MSEAKHTPGPWYVGSATAIVPYMVIAQSDSVCRMTSSRDPSGKSNEAEIAANARLIAAAPDMFAELVETADWLDERADVLVKLLTDPAGWGRGQASTDKKQTIREEVARLRGRAALIRQTAIHKATHGA